MWIRRSVLLVALVVSGFAARADTVKLKDGTVLEGDITAEDNATVSIYLEFSGGTITQMRQIRKADIAGIVRLTPAERAQWHAERDYQKLEKYQLNPNTSYKPDYYDRVINNTFRKFVAQYPDSPYASNVTERILEWKAERDLVAAGNVKLRGWWSPAAEAAHLVERERGQQLLRHARTLIAQGQFEIAVQQLQPIFSMHGEPDLITQARPLLASAYQQALASLDRQRQQLEGDISSGQQRVDQARQAVTDAEASLKRAMDSGSLRDAPNAPPYQPMGGNSQAIVQAQTAVNRTRSELNSAQNHLEQAQSQLALVTEKLAALKSQAVVENVATSLKDSQLANSQVAAPARSTTGDSTEVLVGISGWLKNNWIGIAVLGFVVVLLLSRLMKE